MSATAEAPARSNNGNQDRPRLTREQVAEKVAHILTEAPQSMAALRREILGPSASKGGSDSDLIRDALSVLEAQRRATRIPSRGWVVFDQKAAQPEAKEDISFDEKWAFVKVNDMFVDPSYQRPITSFVNKIQARFNPLLFQLLALSDRGPKHKPQRYAIIDGQTRWAAATRLGVREVPCVIYTGLSPQKEAEMFADLQKERRGMATWHRFRAALAANNKEALAIKSLVDSTGFTIGDQVGQIKAVAALESCYRKDEFLLARTLSDLREAWPEVTPEDVHIRGLHRFFRGYPFEKDKKKAKAMASVDDNKLITRLRTAGPEGLKRKYSAVKEGGTVKGGNDLQMAHAVLGTYRGR